MMHMRVIAHHALDLPTERHAITSVGKRWPTRPASAGPADVARLAQRCPAFLEFPISTNEFPISTNELSQASPDSPDSPSVAQRRPASPSVAQRQRRPATPSDAQRRPATPSPRYHP